MMKKRVAIVTATRAEYDILYPLIKKVNEDDGLELELIVTGTHLLEKYGNTIEAIEDDGFRIDHTIPITGEDNSPKGISITMATCLEKFAECFSSDRPDVLVVLGDRTEMLSIACAAMNEQIPMVHIAGGEITEGAIDDCIRHSLTKMCQIHFTNAEEYRKRVIQLGENPENVYNVGVLALDNIKNGRTFSEDEIRDYLKIDRSTSYIIVTLHPETLGLNDSATNAIELCKAMDECSEYCYVITKSNADTGADEINKVFEDYSSKNDNVVLVDSLGKRYLSALKYAYCMLGNSSSGMGEAPMLGVPTVNVGDRQKGRKIHKTIINCMYSHEAIVDAIRKVKSTERTPTDYYSGGNTAEKMVEIIKKHLANGINLKKGFYDISF